MSTSVAAGAPAAARRTALPWAAAAERLARAIEAELRRGGSGEVEATVRLLGTDDAFAAVDEAWPSPRTVRHVPVHLAGATAIIGPMRGPASGSRPCPRCLARRWQAVCPPVVRDAIERGTTARAPGDLPFVMRFTADAVAAVIAARLDDREDRTGEGRAAMVDAVDLESLSVTRFPLLPDAGCPACGQRTADGPDPERYEFGLSAKPAPDTFRVKRLDQYDLSLKALVNPICGVLGPRLIKEWASPTIARAGGVFSFRTGDHLAQTQWSGHTTSYAHSTRAGLLEGLERWASTAAHTRSVTVTAALSALGTDALDPRTVGLYAAESYEHDDQMVPFDEGREISWVWAYSLRDHRPLLVPEVTAYQQPDAVGGRFVQECSNGCASGGSLAEAAFYGLMERIERDAFLLAWYAMAPLPELDPRSGGGAALRDMRNRLEMYGYHTRFFDTRMTFPIPVVTAVAVRADGGMGTLCFGAGAHLSPETAMAAALAEVAAAVPKLRRLAEREERDLTAMAEDFSRVRKLNDHWLLYGLPRMAPYAEFLLEPRQRRRSLGELDPVASRPRSLDLRDDLRWAVDSVTAQGFDVLVVDQTLPEQRDLGLHTATVLVPGLLPIDFGWRRQRALLMSRLRTAPRTAGLRDRDLDPAEFNPAPHPFP